MKDYVDGFRAWMETKNLPKGQLSADEFAALRKAVAFETKCRSVLRAAWRLVIDLCAIIAAVFSVLAYFKQ